MRSILAAVLCLATACGGNNGGDDDDGPGKPDACVGLECNIVNCGSMQKQPTTITGTVFAPNGTLPLFGANVYVPRDPPPPFTDGVQCDRCSDKLPGSPVTHTQTDEKGEFKLENVPVGDNIPLIVSIGKWRRRITIPKVEACVTAPIAATETRLPKNKMEGDIPLIGITTGDADALECLMRKIGIEDTEITTDTQAGRVHLYFADEGANSIAGAGPMAPATKLWNSLDQMKKYDILVFSCEGAQNPDTKDQNAMNNVKSYADIGGRVFLSHWHNIWVEGATNPQRPQRPQVWTEIATWNNGNTTFGGGGDFDTIDEVANGKGPAFAQWMLNTMGSTQRGRIPIGAQTGKQTCTGVTAGRAERWVYWQNGNTQFPQNFQFTTPNEQPQDQRCGRVVFSDMHVSGDSTSRNNTPFPGGCQAGLTPQEKALAFMFFDIATCVGAIF